MNGLIFALIVGLVRTPNPPDTVGVSGLTPDRPEAYLRVGEDLIESSGTIDLGRETLALAAILAADEDPALAASAVIALAGVARSPEEHRGLCSLAIGLDPARSEEWRWVGRDTAPVDAGREEAAKALGQLRRNDPGVELTPVVRDRITEQARHLGLDPQRFAAVLRKWETDARNDPCRGRMFVPAKIGDALGAEPCPDTSFHHGSRIDEEWFLMVGVELALLEASPPGWGAQAALGLGAPVPVWSLDRLADDLGVSAQRPVYRGGQWTAP